MVFRSRNPYYLRISDRNVLPLYVYLDEAHLDWMSDNILQHVLADLQPKILPKLKAEADLLGSTPVPNKGSKATVDTHRGDSYQFCYFLRRTEQHSVLIKTRHFSAALPQPKPKMPPPPLSQPKATKRKNRKTNAAQPFNKRRKTKGKEKAPNSDESDEAVSSGDEDPVESTPAADASTEPRRSQRNKKLIAGGYQQTDDAAHDSDVEMQENNHVPESVQIKAETPIPGQDEPGGLAAPIDIDIDEDEEKPKPVLTLKYRDFSIYGHCLCIVVEPYPPLPSTTRAASRAPTIAPLFNNRGASATPSNSNSAATLRARTPLFLPDDDDDRSTPAPFIGQGTRPPVPLFDEEQQDDDSDHSDNGGMMAFSQTMNSYSHLPAGAADDGEGLDYGAVFFGDADEVRELD
ncbi:hypothetical protein R3P38DRAFT_2831750 [Favolaschia claudopus]|uniref:Uncharacterized protein n=1 Tax=Favolaschia claudopus TaxID=2862362 RepID=A0AAW0ECC0_9AGAR